MSPRIQSIINILLFVGVIAMNYLSNALPLNGVTQGQLSALYPVLITPAGFTFSIWGIIYMGLTGYIIIQSLPQNVADPRVRSLDAPFRLNCLCNILWLVVWHYQQVFVSVLLMLGLLGSLIWGYLRIDRKRYHNDAASGFFIKNTFSAYLGWISLATIINVSVLLYTLGFDGGPLSEAIWASLLLVIACVIFLYLAFSYKDPAVLLVLMWASFGISIKNQGEQLIVNTCVVVFILCTVLLAQILFSNPRNKQVVQQ